jgi:hypothetical protein
MNRRRINTLVLGLAGLAQVPGLTAQAADTPGPDNSSWHVRADDFYGHDCDRMTADWFPEVMATFYNGIGDFEPWRPTISQRGGVHTEAFDVKVSLPQAGWTIRYTLDGSDPHKGGETTTGAIRISKTSWLRVIGVSPDGKQQSRENLQRYTIQSPWPATPQGGQPGLLFRAYDLHMG